MLTPSNPSERPPPAAASTWCCPRCTYDNPSGAVSCEICLGARPVEVDAGRPAPAAAALAPVRRCGRTRERVESLDVGSSRWSCPRCTYPNPSCAVSCEICLGTRPVEVDAGSPAPAAAPSAPVRRCGKKRERAESRDVAASTKRDVAAVNKVSLTSADLMEAGGERLKVAYQGSPGAYSEAAAKKAYPNCQTVPYEHFDAAFQAVQDRLCHRAVLPLENSLGGSIYRNYDLLLRHKLHIVGEVCLAVRHCLLANPGAKLENLKSVMSHPQALAECEQTLTGLGIEHREAVDDTAGAAKFIADQRLQDTAAIASSLAAELYGLDVLAGNVQDDKDNVTRFMMLSPDPIIARNDKPFKTSIVFSLEEGPGLLFKALAVFALREINLTKIESRPHKNRPLRLANEHSSPLKHFDYLFYVDLEASIADSRTQNALRNLEEFATFLQVLGSYPTDMSEL